MIWLVVAEDHAMVRQGTVLLLEREPDMKVVAQTGDGEEAVRLAAALRPDVVLLDVRLPGLNGVAAAGEIRRIVPQTRVLMVSAYDDDEYVAGALAAGATGYVCKEAPAGQLVEAVRTVARGHLFLDSELAFKVARWWASYQGNGKNAWEPLTARELQVLQLVARGLRNKEIASQLGVSVRTVETHINRILSKLGASSRTEAAVHAMTSGWVALDRPAHE
ncbi:MAG: response regulator transcription factor [Bacillota bacterium]